MQLSCRTRFEPRCEKTGLQGFPTRSHTNQAVQPQKIARGLKFITWEVEGLYRPCSENKGADQLRGYREADLRLCFSHMQKAGFLTTQLIFSYSRCCICIHFSTWGETTKALVELP